MAYTLNISNLPYRQGVYALITSKQNKVLMVLKKRTNHWDFPGGGVEEGENMEEAMKRELKEELGILKVKIIHIGKTTNKYNWPETEVVNHFKKTGVWKRGQEQHFVVVELAEENPKIVPAQSELLDYKWYDIADVKSHMGYPDQYDTVVKVLNELKELKNS